MQSKNRSLKEIWDKKAKLREVLIVLDRIRPLWGNIKHFRENLLQEYLELNVEEGELKRKIDILIEEVKNSVLTKETIEKILGKDWEKNLESLPKEQILKKLEKVKYLIWEEKSWQIDQI